MDEMTAMVRVDRWSWSDLARSLNVAGVTYAGGHWTAALLCSKVGGLRWKQRKREQAETARYAVPAVLLREALGNLGAVNNIGSVVIHVESAPSPSSAPKALEAPSLMQAEPGTPPLPASNPTPPPVDEGKGVARARFAFATLRNHTPTPSPSEPTEPVGRAKPDVMPTRDAYAEIQRRLGVKLPDYDEGPGGED